jgi:hypothetical protein
MNITMEYEHVLYNVAFRVTKPLTLQGILKKETIIPSETLVTA